jgi:flagellar protein FliS
MNARLTYRESAVAGASPVRLVILLYEQLIEDLRRALTACRVGDIEERTRQINHAILIIGCLQSSLDAERGEAVVANLERFYNQVRSGLIDAQCRQSTDAIERQIAHIMLVHEAWCDVERDQAASVRPSAAGDPVEQPPTPIEAGSESRSSAEWNA